jgi:phenylalanine-4-hydroxylase
MGKGTTYESRMPDEKGHIEWTDTENETWAKLITRQTDIIQGRACDEYMKGLEILDFPKDRIPQLYELNEKLGAATGWGVEAVPAVIQPKEFFTLLANKKFPAATFIRTPEELDYLQEPDIFHEVYGHCPLITNQAYADFLETFGKLALTTEPKDRRILFRLFWFTIEFGLVKTKDGLRAYGGGILSSIGETQYCLSDEPETAPFDSLDVLRTPFRIDIMQPLYYVLEEFDDLFHILDNVVMDKLNESKKLGSFPPKYPPKEKPTTEEENEQGAMNC